MEGKEITRMRQKLSCNDLEIIRKSYIIKRRLEIKPLRRALEDRNLEYILETVNHLIENASAYGFKKIETIASEIKKSVLAQKVAEIYFLINSLSEFLESQYTY
jgi:hypothetical protein